MGVYDAQIAQAQKVIKAKGVLVMWVPQSVTPDPAKPWKGTPGTVPTPIPVTMVFVNPGSGFANALLAFMRNTAVVQSSRKGLMGAVPFTPAINDEVLVGTETLTVKDINVVQPSNQPILYKIDFE